jgi:hypothetical protein
MKTIHKIMVGFLILGLLTVSYVWLLLAGKPTTEVIENQMEKITAIRSDLLTQPAINEIKGLERNGDLPVQPGEVKRDNPFDQISQ